jgi:hypothetical protein
VKTEEQAAPGGVAGTTGGSGDAAGRAAGGTPATTDAQPVVVGTGWTSVLVARMPAGALDGASGGKDADRGSGSGSAGQLGALNAVVGNLPRASGSWGSGRVLSAKLFSVLLTDDGRIIAGAVSPDRLYQAAADPKATALKAVGK